MQELFELVVALPLPVSADPPVDDVLAAEYADVVLISDFVALADEARHGVDTFSSSLDPEQVVHRVARDVVEARVRLLDLVDDTVVHPGLRIRRNRQKGSNDRVRVIRAHHRAYSK